MSDHTQPQGQQTAKTVLIVGASFAGLATAWWMRRLGYNVTVAELASGLRKGGTPVDIRESVVDVVQRMDLLEAIKAASLPPRPTEFLGPDGTPLAHKSEGEGEDGADGWEIERDDLLDLLFNRVQDEVEFLFDTSLASVHERAEDLQVTLTSGAQRSFSLLIGCDGTHSAVRRLCFGEESAYLLFLQNYFSLTIVDKLLLPENTSQLFNVPGKTVMLNAYNGKTDIGFCFHSAEEITYDRRDRDQQKRRIVDHFGVGAWRIDELLAEMRQSDNLYFDKLCQIRMKRWTKGRVALVGDAGYCPSPAAGMGGSMALLGAAALADALAGHPEDLKQAFEVYNSSLRPVVDEIQANAVNFGLKMFLPTTEAELQARNAQLGLG